MGLKDNKLIRALGSMWFGLVLLGFLSLACVAGSLIPQKLEPAQYSAMYGGTWAGVITALQLDRVFTAPWFLAGTALLIINLTFCSITRFPRLLDQHRQGFQLEKRLLTDDATARFQLMAGDKNPESLFPKLGFRAPLKNEAGQLYAARRRLGIWGAWLSHLAILVIVVGFGLGQVLMYDRYVVGVPGDSLPLPDTDLIIHIDDFTIQRREDYSASQYTAKLRVENSATGELLSGTTQVNAPLAAFGYHFFQNATGWAITAHGHEEGKPEVSQLLFPGDVMALGDTGITLQYNALYPDYVRTREGPGTKSPYPNNPAALFTLRFEGKMVDMNLAGMGYDIKVGGHRFVMDEPREYTLIQAVRDPAMGVAAAGGAMILIGLLLAFYLRPEELYLLPNEHGYALYGRSPKGALLYTDKIKTILRKEGFLYEQL